MSRGIGFSSLNKRWLTNLNKNLVEALGLPKEDFSEPVSKKFLLTVAKCRYQLFKDRYPRAKTSIGWMCSESLTPKHFKLIRKGLSMYQAEVACST